MLTALSMLIALSIDWFVGWPEPLFRRIGHPVTWMGAAISYLERCLNKPSLPQRLIGLIVALIVVLGTVIVTWGVTVLLPGGPVGAIIAGVLAWPLVAARSMFDHVEAVRRPLARNDIAAARSEVAKIVGRDPDMLDDAGVARAAIESLAENTSDGIVAPLFWGVVFGLPGIAGYKAINTLDSMIGHRNDRYHAFGWAAARTDDIANLIPARLTAVIFAIVGTSRRAFRVVWTDARLHRSPNAGWPEAAMAGALNVRLSGPRGYGGAWSDEPWVNASGPDPTAKDLGHALRIYLRLLAALAGLLAVLVLM